MKTLFKQANSIFETPIPSSELQFHLRNSNSIFETPIPSSKLQFHLRNPNSIFETPIPSSKPQFHLRNSNSIFETPIPSSKPQFHLRNSNSILETPIPSSKPQFHLRNSNSIFETPIPSSKLQFHPRNPNSIFETPIPSSKLCFSFQNEKDQKTFVIKPIPSTNIKPLIVFINPKSGGNQGAKLLQKFQWLLNPRQVFDLTQGGPKMGLLSHEHFDFKSLININGYTDEPISKILEDLEMSDIGYTDEPISKILEDLEMSDIAYHDICDIYGYTDEPISKILEDLEMSDIAYLDRWDLKVEKNPNAEPNEEGKENLPLNVLNNYFSLGVDAHIALEFHEARGKWFALSIVQLSATKICVVAALPPATLEPMKLSVQKISMFDYEQNHYDKNLLRQKAITAERFFRIDRAQEHLHFVMDITSDTLFILDTLPPTPDDDPSFPSPTTPSQQSPGDLTTPDISSYRSLYQTSFKKSIQFNYPPLSPPAITAERFFRIDRAQEHLHFVMDITSDTLFILDTLPPTPDDDPTFPSPTTPSQQSPGDLTTPDISSGCTCRVKCKLHCRPSSTQASRNPRTPNTSRNVRIALPEDDVRLRFVEADYPSEDQTGGESGEKINSHPPDSNPGTHGTKHSSTGAEQGLLKVPRIGSVEDLDADEVDIGPVPASECSISRKQYLRQRLFGYEYFCNILEKTSEGVLKAARVGDIKMLKDLHSQGYSLLSIDSVGQTALHYGSRYGHKDVVKYIIACAPSSILNMQDNDKGQTALHKAAMFKRRSICCMLVAGGASLTVKDYDSNTPRALALLANDTELAAYLESKSLYGWISFMYW
ncbi:eye-specific diacylglycerol kinase-like [Diaphorina citri]|uniref:Eye-specific diacylglycerol kinase-like n=1 Tax=Diaphorina citri TaxID=121845 RepID=A0A3Q0JNQ1_DIACI|nr:eye-specific diacylglycerol kinase-like [Diaphorina citri]